MNNILEGVKIIDLTRAVAGPFASQILSDFGADIIKVEPPQGDDSRQWGPYVNGESGFFMSLNRGKKSICLNLKEEGGKQVIRDLVKDADVIMGELFEILYQLRKQSQIKAVILTGAGKVFIAGADISEFEGFDGESGLAFTERNELVRDYLYRFPKPVICALNGSANGGGLGLALMCDIRITHANAKFALGEINNGFFSYAQILAAHCINGGVRKLVYSGERISAAEAM